MQDKLKSVFFSCKQAWKVAPKIPKILFPLVNNRPTQNFLKWLHNSYGQESISWESSGVG